jgi:hypothetical protein
MIDGRPFREDRGEKDWVRSLGTVMVVAGVGMWIPYAVGKYLLGWAITDRDFLPYHLAVIIPGMILRYYRFFFSDLWVLVLGARGEQRGTEVTDLPERERETPARAVTIVNNFVHDLFTGLWTSTVLVIYLLKKKTMGPGGMLISPALCDVMRFFFWLGIVSLAVTLTTGGLRLLYYRRDNIGDGGETKKKILIVKHVLFTVVFLGGTYLAYLYTFK